MSDSDSDSDSDIKKILKILKKYKISTCSNCLTMDVSEDGLSKCDECNISFCEDCVYNSSNICRCGGQDCSVFVCKKCTPSYCIFKCFICEHSSN